MRFLEKDLEDIIFNSDRALLSEKGLDVEFQLKRQLRIGNYGIADIIGHSRPYYHTHFKRLMKGCITIYELKQHEINVNTFLQALGYLKGIHNYLLKRDMQDYYNYEIVLIGRTININNNFSFLTDFLQHDKCDVEVFYSSIFNLSYYTYDYDINGIVFDRKSGYSLKQEGF